METLGRSPSFVLRPSVLFMSLHCDGHLTLVSIQAIFVIGAQWECYSSYWPLC